MILKKIVFKYLTVHYQFVPSTADNFKLKDNKTGDSIFINSIVKVLIKVFNIPKMEAVEYLNSWVSGKSAKLYSERIRPK